MITIGKNTLTGTAVSYDTAASSSMTIGSLAAVCPDDQVLTSMHLGYGDIGGQGTVEIKAALYDITNGVDGSQRIDDTVVTFVVDMSSISGNTWISLENLNISLAGLAGRKLAILVATPNYDTMGIVREPYAGATRSRNIPKAIEPPAVFNEYSSSTEILSLYGVIQDAATVLNTAHKDNNTEALAFFIASTGTRARDFNTAAIAYYKSVTNINSNQFNDLLRAAQKAVGFVGKWPGDRGN